MKSFFAVELRRIFPLLARAATVDFFGTDDFAELPFDFDDALFEDEARLVEDDLDELPAPPFCAGEPTDRRTKRVSNAVAIRWGMANLRVF